MSDKKSAARFAGILYLVIIITSVYGHMYVPSQIFVQGDVRETVNNILRDEFLFRSCIVAGMVETTAFLLLGHALYMLFREVDVNKSRLMLSLILAQIPLSLGFAILKLMALASLKSEGMAAAINPAAIRGTAMMFLDIFRSGSALLISFQALWLLPLGVLVVRSKYMPGIIGVLILVAGIGNIIYGILPVLFPGLSLSFYPLLLFFAISEVPVMLWLLMKGINTDLPTKEPGSQFLQLG